MKFKDVLQLQEVKKKETPPKLRPADQCMNCRWHDRMPGSGSLEKVECEKYNTIVNGGWICDSFAK